MKIDVFITSLCCWNILVLNPESDIEFDIISLGMNSHD